MVSLGHELTLGRKTLLRFITTVSVAEWKTAISPLLTQWRYCSHAQSHWNVHSSAEEEEEEEEGEEGDSDGSGGETSKTPRSGQLLWKNIKRAVKEVRNNVEPTLVNYKLLSCWIFFLGNIEISLLFPSFFNTEEMQVVQTLPRKRQGLVYPM